MLFMYPFIYRSPDEAGGSGGSDQQPGSDSGQQPDPTQAFHNLLQRHSDDTRAVAQLLFNENYQYWQELRQAQQQLQDVQDRIPGD